MAPGLCWRPWRYQPERDTRRPAGGRPNNPSIGVFTVVFPGSLTSSEETGLLLSLRS